jgi:hypothetical protein
MSRFAPKRIGNVVATLASTTSASPRKLSVSFSNRRTWSAPVGYVFVNRARAR